MRVLIALGGNALLPRGVVPDARAQIERIAVAAPTLARVAQGHELILTHGNGPQVGLLAVESSDDHSLSRPYPLDALVAETQGMIGYWLQQAIASAGLARPVVTLVTQTVVAADDPAFTDPTKFVGATMTEDEAARVAAARGWTVRPDGAAWRRVVPSPEPCRVVEAPTIEALVGLGTTVICAGGGGSPVVETPDGLTGVEAVVDKDLVASLLARVLHADLLVMLTDVPAVIADYGTPAARPLGSVCVEELEELSFAAGSMGPKVDAACTFVRRTGRRAVIGALDDVEAILAGAAGTRISSC